MNNIYSLLIYTDKQLKENPYRKREDSFGQTYCVEVKYYAMFTRINGLSEYWHSVGGIVEMTHAFMESYEKITKHQVEEELNRYYTDEMYAYNDEDCIELRKKIQNFKITIESIRYYKR